jgi:translation initiation factor 2 beta subunit (eIF-2beta)/eIF-5
MDKVNISDSDDIYNRYKRDQISVTYIGKNGISTQLNNIDSICKQMNVATNMLIKYLKKSLGMSITNNIIRSEVRPDKIEQIIRKFTKEYVLCPNCGLPELVYDKSKRKCNSCGFIQKIKN